MVGAVCEAAIALFRQQSIVYY